MLEGRRRCIGEDAGLDATTAWCGEVPGTAPHFDEPLFVGFDVGGNEPRLLPADRADAPGGGRSHRGVPASRRHGCAVRRGAGPRR